MITQFYVARTGLRSLQESMINITNNIANSQTPAFRKADAEFEFLWWDIMAPGQPAYFDSDTWDPSLRKKHTTEKGMGVRIVAISRDYTPGKIEITRRPLDLALEGDGFFKFIRKDGSEVYSRAGNMLRNHQGYLVNHHGDVLDPPIRIPNEVSNEQVTIAPDGRVLVQERNELQQREVGQITVTRFSNMQGLKPIGQNLFLATKEADDPITDLPGKRHLGRISQYALEGSNVDIIDEMTQMMITQENFDVLAQSLRVGERILVAAM